MIDLKVYKTQGLLQHIKNERQRKEVPLRKDRDRKTKNVGKRKATELI